MRILLALLAVLTGACGAAPARYAVPADVGSLVVDDAAFATFERDLRRELGDGAGGGAAHADRLFLLALLDALDDDWASAVARLDRIAADEPDPDAKAMRGLTIRIWADARAAGTDTPEGFAAAMERRLAAMPVDRLRDQLAMLRAMAQTFTPEVCRQLVDQEVAPHVQHGAVDLADASAIAFQRYAVVRLVPVATQIDEMLGRLGITTPSALGPSRRRARPYGRPAPRRADRDRG